MKKSLSYLPFIFLSLRLFAQAPAIQWQRYLGGTFGDAISAIRQTADGGYIAAGSSASSDGGITGHHGNPNVDDFWVIKLDAGGMVQWQKVFGGSGYDDAYSIDQTTDGGYVVAGYCVSTFNDGDVTGNHTSPDAWVIKLDGAGNLQWQKSLGGFDYDGAYAIQSTSDGGSVIVGTVSSNDGDVGINHGNGDGWVVKLDATGNIQWKKAYGGSAGDLLYDIRQTTDGGFIMAGSSLSVDGDATGNDGGSTDVWVVKVSANGTLQWQKTFGGTEEDQAWSIRLTDDGGYIVAGFSKSNNGDVTGGQGDADFWILKLDAAGNLQWQKTLGGTQFDLCYSVYPTADGGYVAAGFTRSSDGDVTVNAGDSDSWLVKLSASGDLEWEKSFGTVYPDEAYSVQQTTDGGFIAAGIANISAGVGDGWIVKLAPVVSGVKNVPGDQTPLTVFNDPADRKVTVQMDSPYTLNACQLSDMAGRLVSSVAFQIPVSEASLDVNNLSKGVYILQVRSEDRFFSRKVLLR